MKITRRQWLASSLAAPLAEAQRGRPNILFAIADDQSWRHTGANGDRIVKTPGFDRVAAAGVRFTNAITASPGCAPSRAAILTGRYPWQLEEAGTHASSFPAKLAVFPDILERAGYAIGFTGKGAGPTDWKGSGWKRNPAGPLFDSRAQKNPDAVSQTDYAGNFEDFLARKPQSTPFCFWYGGHEPHRRY